MVKKLGSPIITAKQRGDVAYANYSRINKSHRETTARFILEQGHYCLDSLQANAEALDAKLGIFFGIAVSALSGLTGVIVFQNGLSYSQYSAAAAASCYIFASAAFFGWGMFPKTAYQVKGSTPYAILNVEALVSNNEGIFIRGMIGALEEKIGAIESQNFRLGQYIKSGMIMLISAPVIGILFFCV